MKFTVKEIEKVSMTEEKRRNAKNDIVAFYIGRPISYFFTIPCLYLGIKPNTVSLISIFFPVIAFACVCVESSFENALVGWLCLFAWNIMDGVDGNIARYTKKSSNLGSVWDATGGYFAMFFTFSYLGMVAYWQSNSVMYIIQGFLSGMSCIMPRLIMHKKLSTFGNSKDELNDKASFNFGKICILNLSSVSGLAQLIVLFAVIFRYSEQVTVFYFCLNVIIMIVAMYKIFKE